MLQSFRKFLDDFLLPTSADTADHSEHRLRLATAALMMEMARADFAEHPDEHAHALSLLQREFGLSHQEAARLADLGREEAHTAVSLYDFTATLDKSLSVEDKLRIIEMLWGIAYADGALDKYEEHLLRKLADLLHLSHRQLIQAKHRVLEAVGG